MGTLKKRNKQEEFSTNFTYEIEDIQEEIEVTIRYIPRRTINQIAKESKKFTFDRGSRIEDIDAFKMNEKMVREALVDIKGLTWRKLRYLIEPDQEIILDTGEKWTDPVAFEGDIKDMVIQHITGDFWQFVFSAATSVHAHQKAQEAREMENLSSGSGTKNRSKDTAPKN
jgi:hypothetical protein